MATIIHDNVVVPVVIVEGIIFAVGFAFFGILAKNSLTYFAPQKHVNRSEQEKVITCGCCLSPVHGMAIAHYLCFVEYSISLLFVTNLLYKNINCDIVESFAFAGFVGAKTTQWGFFTLRLEYVFRETALAVPRRTLQLLGGVAFVHFILQTIFLILLVTTTGTFRFQTTGKLYDVCSYSDSPFAILTLCVYSVYIVCDAIIMVTVVRGFTIRLLKIASRSVGSRNSTIATAYRALALYMFSVISSLALVCIGNVYPHHMVTYLAPYVDMLLNIIAVVAVFRFGDFVYYTVCAPCNPCISSLVIGCCGRNEPELRTMLLQVGAIGETYKHAMTASLTAGGSTCADEWSRNNVESK